MECTHDHAVLKSTLDVPTYPSYSIHSAGSAALVLANKGGFGSPSPLSFHPSLYSPSLPQLETSTRSEGLPLIGNVRHMSDTKWLTSPQRKDDFGEIMYISALGRASLF
ncbi:hypothetical protein EI94DRAFT_1300027 [Lactarius quietus]|nr:hypothetical protein EI94DRAFT_1300027 [Lactarius quietus]